MLEIALHHKDNGTCRLEVYRSRSVCLASLPERRVSPLFDGFRELVGRQLHRDSAVDTMDNKAFFSIPSGFTNLLLQAGGIGVPAAFIEARVAKLKRKGADPSLDYEGPKDLITWINQSALDDTHTRMVSPKSIGTRLSI